MYVGHTIFVLVVFFFMAICLLVLRLLGFGLDSVRVSKTWTKGYTLLSPLTKELCSSRAKSVCTIHVHPTQKLETSGERAESIGKNHRASFQSPDFITNI